MRGSHIQRVAPTEKNADPRSPPYANCRRPSAVCSVARHLSCDDAKADDAPCTPKATAGRQVATTCERPPLNRNVTRSSGDVSRVTSSSVFPRETMRSAERPVYLISKSPSSADRVALADRRPGGAARQHAVVARRRAHEDPQVAVGLIEPPPALVERNEPRFECGDGPSKTQQRRTLCPGGRPVGTDGPAARVAKRLHVKRLARHTRSLVRPAQVVQTCERQARPFCGQQRPQAKGQCDPTFQMSSHGFAIISDSPFSRQSRERIVV